MKSISVTKDLTWVGVIDSEVEVFDVVMKTEHGSSYNSYLLDTGDGVILFDTVKLFTENDGIPSYDDFVGKLKEIIGDLKKIKYIVVTHTEPDHSGSVLKISKECDPNCQIIGSAVAIDYLEHIFNKKFNSKEVKDQEVMKIGNKTLKFFLIPMLHWPDSIFTLIEEDRAIITCDTLGAHYAFKDMKISLLKPNKEEEFKNSFVHYYNCIMSPYKPFVKMAMMKIQGIRDKFDVVGTGHGPLLDTPKWIDYAINVYKEHSTVKKEQKKKIIVLMSSAYGFTQEIKDSVIEGMKKSDENNDLMFKEYNLDAISFNEKLINEIRHEIHTATGILCGTPTINNDAIPYFYELFSHVSPAEDYGKFAGVFGSYGWSGEAVGNVTQRLSQLRMKTVKALRIRFRQSKEQRKDAIKWGEMFGKYILTRKTEPDFIYRNTKLEEILWK